MAKREAVAAVSRIGLGARPGELARAASDPRGWAEAQLGVDPRLPAALAKRPTTAALVKAGADAREAGEGAREAFRKEARERYLEDVAARCATRATTERPVYERLVAFLANHFAVSVGKHPVIGLAGAFEREVVRPRATGRFVDLLVASTRHPAMLLYLDQQQSVGPHSKVGTRGEKGLNENLAREILELHTLGVDGGYAQADVEALAAALTGWGLGTDEEGGRDGFAFRPNRHEPGAVTVLGTRYADDGADQALAVLHDLAAHPSTARFVCGKLARHFVADEPPAALTDAMVDTYQESGGHLGHVLVTMLAHDACWSEDARKLRTPDDLVTATARAFEVSDGEVMVRSLTRLGQPVWAPPSPAGWPDDTASWSGSGLVLERVEWATDVGDRLDDADARAILDATLGERVSARTAEAVSAASGARAVALLVGAPEFQWR